MTARLLGTLLLACAGAGLGACGAVRRQAVEKRIRLLSRLWTYLEELLTCRALTGPMLLHAVAENPAFAALALPADSDCTLSALPLPNLPKVLAGELHASLAALGHSDRAAACAELRRMADLCRREADRQADRAPRAIALWPRLGDLVFKIAATGIIVAVLNQLLIRSGREDQAMMTTLAGLIVVLSMLVRQISDLFVLIKALFEL